MSEKIYYNAFVQRDLKKSLNSSLYPSWNDRDFKDKWQAVFLAEEIPGKIKTHISGPQQIRGATYEYSDRMSCFFSEEKLEEAWKEASKGVKAGKFEKQSAAHYEAWLRNLYDDPQLKLVHFLVAINSSGGGYPYYRYGFVKGK